MRAYVTLAAASSGFWYSGPDILLTYTLLVAPGTYSLASNIPPAHSLVAAFYVHHYNQSLCRG